MLDNFELGEDEMSLRQAWPFLRNYMKSGTRIAEHASICVYKTDKCFLSTKVEVQIIQCAYIFTCHQTDVCEQRLGSPEAVTIATAGCPSAVRATVLYKAPQTASENYPKIPLKSWHLWKAMYTLHEERNDAKKIHQSGGCLLGGPLVGIRRGSLRGSLKFEALSLSVFFFVFPWRSSFSGGSSEDLSFAISSSVFLNTLKNGQVRTCIHLFLINLSMYLKI